jgi:hypothetical protein
MFRLAVILVQLLLLGAAVPGLARDTAFLHVNVVPMDRERVLRDQTVVVSDGRIVAIGRGLPAPDGALTVDGRGKLWLSPGLADMHVHSDTRDDLALYLGRGITTIANMGDARASFVGRTAPAAARGDIAGPQVFNAFVLDGSPQYGHFTVTTPAEARAAVGLAKTNGFRFIKVYNNLSAEVFAAAADEARRQGLPIVGHGVTSVGLASQIEQGQALVAHAEEFFYTFFTPPGVEQTDAPPADGRMVEALALVRRHKVAVGADLATYGGIMRVIGRPEVVAGCLATGDSLVSPADRLVWRRSSYLRKTADLRAKYAFLQRLVKMMADGGVELLSGSDAPTIPCLEPGVSLHDNLAELEKAGLTRFQALSTATRMPGAFIARTIGGPRFGIVEAGARADLVLTEANPLDGLATLRRPVGVMVGGRWHDAAAISTMLKDVRAAYAHH